MGIPPSRFARGAIAASLDEVAGEKSVCPGRRAIRPPRRSLALRYVEGSAPAPVERQRLLAQRMLAGFTPRRAQLTLQTSNWIEAGGKIRSTSPFGLRRTPTSMAEAAHWFCASRADERIGE